MKWLQPTFTQKESQWLTSSHEVLRYVTRQAILQCFIEHYELEFLELVLQADHKDV